MLYHNVLSGFIIKLNYKFNVRGKMMNERPLKSKVSITLDDDVIEKIRNLAEEDDRNFSQYINMILKKHIKEQNKTSK